MGLRHAGVTMTVTVAPAICLAPRARVLHRQSDPEKLPNLNWRERLPEGLSRVLM